MFDAKAILESIVRGAAPQAQAPQGGGGLGDILGQILQGGAQQNQGSGGGGLGGGLGDILEQIGKLTNPKNKTLKDLSWRELGLIAPLLFLMVLLLVSAPTSLLLIMFKA